MDRTERDMIVSRRKLLAGASGLAAGGVTWAAVGTQGVRAQVAPESLSVGDATWTAPEGEIYSPRIDVDVAWSYEGADAATAVMTAMLIDESVVASEMGTTTGPSDSGTRPLGAPVVESRAYDTSMWQPPAEGEVSHEVGVEVRLEVRDGSGETLASDAASDTAVITVRHGGPTTAAAVGGTGNVTFLPSGGATPTG